MKKLFLMLACSSMCIMGMNAQEKLVKEVEKEIGAAKYATLSEKLKPAFTDATSEKDAYTWFVAAKVEMNEFDELFKQKMIGKSVDATVKFFAPLTYAAECDLIERNDEPIAYEGDSISFHATPFEIKNFKVKV